MTELPNDNPYEPPSVAAEPKLFRFPWGSASFNWLGLIALLTVGIANRGIQHPDRLALLAIVAILAPFLLAIPFAAAIRLVSNSPFLQRYFPCVLAFNSLFGILLLLFAFVALMIELGDPWNLVPRGI